MACANRMFQYPDAASPWAIILNLVVGWFLVYIYSLVSCTYLYEYLKTTRFRFILRTYAHIERNDPLLLYLANQQNQDNGDENEAPLLENVV